MSSNDSFSKPSHLGGRGIRSIVGGNEEVGRSPIGIRSPAPPPGTEERRLAWPLDPYACASGFAQTVYPKVLVLKRAGQIDVGLDMTDPTNWVTVTRGSGSLTAGASLSVTVTGFDVAEMAGTVTSAVLTSLGSSTSPIELGIEYTGSGTDPRTFEYSGYTADVDNGVYGFDLWEPNGVGGYKSVCTAPPYSAKERYLVDPARWSYEGSLPVNTTAPNIWPAYPYPQPFRIRFVLNANWGSLALLPVPVIGFGTEGLLDVDLPVKFMGGSLS